MTWTPETNRITWGLLTPEEQGAMLAARHGWRRIDDYTPSGWVEDRHPTWSPDRVYRAIPVEWNTRPDADRIEALEAKLARPREARMGKWDEMMNPAREALEALIANGDEMADRIEELEAKLAKLIAALEEREEKKP